MRNSNTASTRTVRHASDFRALSPQPATPEAVAVATANDAARSASPHPSKPVGTVRKARRSFRQVIEQLPNEYEEAAYAMSRINASELKIDQVLSSVSQETLPLILAKRPDLKRYMRD